MYLWNKLTFCWIIFQAYYLFFDMKQLLCFHAILRLVNNVQLRGGFLVYGSFLRLFKLVPQQFAFCFSFKKIFRTLVLQLCNILFFFLKKRLVNFNHNFSQANRNMLFCWLCGVCNLYPLNWCFIIYYRFLGFCLYLLPVTSISKGEKWSQSLLLYLKRRTGFTNDKWGSWLAN